MGASTAAALLRGDPSLDIALASRSRGSFEDAVKKRPELAGTRVRHHSSPMSVEPELTQGFCSFACPVAQQ